ncbi:750_t:CDS:2, partial [Racocetra persica]
NLGTDDKSVIDKFISELESYKKIDYHNSILKFYGITQDVSSKKYFLVFEYADGGTLRRYLQKNFSSLSWNDKLNLARQIASGIVCLHDNDIILGNLNSNNILLSDGVIKITDFGLSKNSSQVTRRVSDAKVLEKLQNTEVPIKKRSNESISNNTKPRTRRSSSEGKRTSYPSVVISNDTLNAITEIQTTGRSKKLGTINTELSNSAFNGIRPSHSR